MKEAVNYYNDCFPFFGAAGVKLYIRLFKKKPPEQVVKLIQEKEKSGFCDNYGMVPVLITSCYLVPYFLSQAAMGMGVKPELNTCTNAIFIAASMVSVSLAMRSHKTAIQKSEVRKLHNPAWYIRMVQFRTYTGSLAVMMAAIVTLLPKTANPMKKDSNSKPPGLTRNDQLMQPLAKTPVFT